MYLLQGDDLGSLCDTLYGQLGGNNQNTSGTVGVHNIWYYRNLLTAKFVSIKAC